MPILTPCEVTTKITIFFGDINKNYTPVLTPPISHPSHIFGDKNITVVRSSKVGNNYLLSARVGLAD